MRVALLTNFIPPYRISLFRALRAEVGDLRIFISTTMGRDRAWTPDWGDLDVVVQKSWSITRSWKQSSFEEPIEVHFPYDTIARLAEYRPDRIVTAELGLRSLQALGFGKARRIPVTLWATLSDRTETHWGAGRRFLRKLMIPRFDGVIVNGEEGARYIRRFRTDPPLRVPYTTDAAPFLALSLQGRPRELLFVGSLTHRKGFHLLAEACAIHGFRLIVVGDGPLRRPVDSIEYVGNVPYADLPKWFARAGFLVMPSLADEWGVVVNEALAAGVPVIGSNYSQAVSELIDDGVNGFRFDPADADAVTRAIQRANAVDDATLLRMRQQARATSERLRPGPAAQRIAEMLNKQSSGA